MDDFESLSHPKWECKYHVVFIPNGPPPGAVPATVAAPRRGVPQVGAAEGESGRGRALDGRSRAHDAVDTAEVCGVAGGWVQIKGKSAIHSARVYGERKRNFVALSFWARGVLSPAAFDVRPIR
jgi:putative transposase